MDSVVAKLCVMYVMCLVCPTAAGMAVLAAAGMSGLDHINCVHCLLQVPGFGWQSLGSGVAVLLCRCAVGCHLWTACDWLCLTLSSCSWHRLVLLLALPYSVLVQLALPGFMLAWFTGLGDVHLCCAGSCLPRRLLIAQRLAIDVVVC